MSRKRRFEETENNREEIETEDTKVEENGFSSDTSKMVEQIENFRKLILSEEPVEKKSFKKFLRILSDIKDDEKFQKRISKLIDTKLLSGLLCRYNASNSKIDLVIYKILRSLERNIHINLRILAPIVWGIKAKPNYEQLIQFGQSLHQRMKTDQVLEFFDAQQLWWTLLKMDNEKMMEETSNFYDPRFVAAILFSIVAPGSDLTYRKFVTSNALAFTFALTSSNDDDLRAYGYGILQRYLNLLKELSVEEFPERILYKFVISVFKNSVMESNQRLPHAISHFFARLTKLMLNPEDPVFAPLLAFFQVKPTLLLDQVPEFYKLFLSSSTEHFKAERHWILRLVSDSMIDVHDFTVLEANYCIPLCLSLFSSPISDMESRSLILQLLKSCLQHSSIAMSLFNLYSIHSWFNYVLKLSRTTRWEVGFIAELFVLLLEKLKENFIEKSGKDKFLASVKRKEIIVKLNAKQALIELGGVDDEAKSKNYKNLKRLIEEPWNL